MIRKILGSNGIPINANALICGIVNTQNRPFGASVDFYYLNFQDIILYLLKKQNEKTLGR